MARPLRIELAGGLYHVTSRGDRREDIFLCDTDRRVWLEIFAEVCERFNWVCHAWCQMTNHYHIVVETCEGNLSQGMRQLNGVYTRSTVPITVLATFFKDATGRSWWRRIRISWS